MFEWVILITVTLAALAATPSKGRRPAKRQQAARCRTIAIRSQRVAPRRSATTVSPELIAGIEAQREAACELGDAYRERGKRQSDPVRRAKDAKLSADAYACADKLQAQIDKLLLAA